MLRLVWRLLAVALVCLPAGVQGAPPLRFMTFNIRYDNPGDAPNHWEARRGLVADRIRAGRPDVLALQEGLPHQMSWLREELGGYSVVGCGRDGDGANEWTALLIRDERLKVLSQGRQWLSDTPDQPGSIGWGASLPRLIVWADLQDLTADKRLLACGTHFDHESAESREKGARAMVSLLAERERAADAVAVLGDLNATQETAEMRTLLSGPPRLTDPLADSPLQASTFNAFQAPEPGMRIDYVLLSAGLKAAGAQIDDARPGGRWPSDHFPVTVEAHWVD